VLHHNAKAAALGDELRAFYFVFCIVLQFVAVCCSVPQCVATCCGVLRCVAVCCSVLQCAAVRCGVLQRYAKATELFDELKTVDLCFAG